MRLLCCDNFFILDRMKESRTKKQSETDSEISAWVTKSRKLEKKRALKLSKIFEEQVFPPFMLPIFYDL